VRWVRFEATIPEPLANVFSTLTPWKWRELRPFFCRYPENRRLKNIGGAIHSILEKAPHMLARGHWSVEQYIASRRRLAAEIASLAKLVAQVAAEARIQIPIQDFGEARRPRQSPEDRLIRPVAHQDPQTRFSGGPDARRTAHGASGSGWPLEGPIAFETPAPRSFGTGSLKSGPCQRT
jgi:hypothetical protein